MDTGNLLLATAEATGLMSLGSETFGSVLLAFSIEFPFLIAVGLLILDDDSKRMVRNLALSGFVVPAVISLFLAVRYHAFYQDGYVFYGNLSTGLESFGISFKFGLNGISLPLYLLAGIVGLAAGIYAVRSDVERIRHYLCLLLFMQGGLMGVFASVDLFFFYFFHEVALIPTFIMIAVWGHRGRRSAAMELAIYLTLGAMLSLLGLVALYIESGLDSFDLISLKTHLRYAGLSTVLQKYAFGLLLFGFGILVSLWPFHSWAPRGYGAAPTSTAMMHAGVLKKFGLYGLIQIGAPLLPEGALAWSHLLVWLALGNVVIIGFVTIAQRDLRQMIGFSSVMHMGYAFLGIACLSEIGVGGAVVLMFAHGLSVALLFLLSTCVYKRSGTFDMESMGGLATQAPVLAGFFVAATLAAAGLPGFANFWGELAIFVGLWDYHPWLLFPAVAGIVISAIYGLRAVSKVFFGEPSEAFKPIAERGDIVDMLPQEKLPAALLLGVLLTVGFWPRMITDSIDEAVRHEYPIIRVSETALVHDYNAARRRVTADHPDVATDREITE
jgi:NADH-quinone oxidoreductase subunit M